MYHYHQERRHRGINYLTPYQELLKLELEEQKGQNLSTDGQALLESKPLTDQPVEEIKNSNHIRY